MRVNGVDVSVQVTVVARKPGWCAFNSAHSIRVGDTIGSMIGPGTTFGWACAECTRKAGQ